MLGILDSITWRRSGILGIACERRVHTCNKCFEVITNKDEFKVYVSPPMKRHQNL